jgi:RNA polymerase sigma-70 factor (ECF subfamily)
VHPLDNQLVPSIAAAADPDPATDAGGAARLERLVRAEFPYVWRLCRRLGLPEGDADDATQQVFLAVSRRLGDVRSGSERSFLYGVAVNIACKWRKVHARRREDSAEQLESIETTLPNVEELLERRDEVVLLDALLEAMPDELRTVFVLHEIEQQSAPQIARVLGIPIGTAASRLRRARDDFATRLGRLQARRRFEGVRR